MRVKIDGDNILFVWVSHSPSIRWRWLPGWALAAKRQGHRQPIVSLTRVPKRLPKRLGSARRRMWRWRGFACCGQLQDRAHPAVGAVVCCLGVPWRGALVVLLSAIGCRSPRAVGECLRGRLDSRQRSEWTGGCETARSHHFAPCTPTIVMTCASDSLANASCVVGTQRGVLESSRWRDRASFAGCEEMGLTEARPKDGQGVVTSRSTRAGHGGSLFHQPPKSQ